MIIGGWGTVSPAGGDKTETWWQKRKTITHQVFYFEVGGGRLDRCLLHVLAALCFLISVVRSRRAAGLDCLCDGEGEETGLAGTWDRRRDRYIAIRGPGSSCCCCHTGITSLIGGKWTMQTDVDSIPLSPIVG